MDHIVWCTSDYGRVRIFIFHNCNRIIRLRTMFLLTIPLIGLTGLWQFPIFYGMNLPHECHESNQTFHRHLVDNYTDCMMESTYTSEFEELVDFFAISYSLYDWPIF